MAIKHLVVDGAICMCNYGVTPDFLKVISQKKEYANDAQGVKKLIAGTMDIGCPFQAGTFGVCVKTRAVCKSSVIQWSGYYSKTQLSNNGYPLLEDSKATCPVGGTDCIRIVFHGQITEINKPDLFAARPQVTKILNPAVKLSDVWDDPNYVI